MPRVSVAVLAVFSITVVAATAVLAMGPVRVSSKATARDISLPNAANGSGAAPAQAATPTPDPRPNLVAESGYWAVKGRNVSTWSRCVFGDDYEQGLHLCVRNAGNAPSGPFAVAAEGSPGAALLTTGGLLPDETLCAPVDAAPGVALLIDPGGAVDESNEGDNRLAPVPVPTLAPVAYPTCAPRATPLAELSGSGVGGFVDLGGYPCWPSPGTRFVYWARVANDGEVAAGPFRVGPPDWRIPDLPADASRTTHDPALVPEFSAAIDPDHAVPEHDETNNTLYVLHGTAPPMCTATPTPILAPTLTPTPSSTPTAGPPDLTASFSFDFPDCEGEDGTLSGRAVYRPCILNQGGTEATGFLVRFGEGASAQDVDIPELDAGGRLCLAGRDLTATIIDVDPDDRVAESDETNNRVPVLPPPQARPPLCTPGPTPTATPSPVPLPNLRGWARWWIDLPEGCIPTDRPMPPWFGELTVMNDGAAPAGSFDAVAEPPWSRRWAFGALPAGATYVRGPVPFDFAHVVIDPDDRVVESDETDNHVYVPVPTLPPYCPTKTITPTGGTVSPTPSPETTPSGTPSPLRPGRALVPVAWRLSAR